MLIRDLSKGVIAGFWLIGLCMGDVLSITKKLR